MSQSFEEIDFIHVQSPSTHYWVTQELRSANQPSKAAAALSRAGGTLDNPGLETLYPTRRRRYIS
jgi:hypothetical protein